MRKKFTILTAALALLAMLAVPAGMRGQTRDQYSYTFTANAWTSNGDATLNGVVWTLDMEGGTISSFSETQGMHFGTNNSTCTSVSISTTGISGTITSVAVEASRGSSLVGTLGISVGGTSFYCGNSTTNALTTTNATYTFTGSNTGSNSGAIDILWTKSSGKGAYYIKSITVTYSTSTGPVTLNAPVLNAAAGNGQVTLTWAAVSNASSYTIMWADNEDFIGGTEIVNATSPKLFENLTNGQTYYFKAKSIGDGTNYISSEYGTAVSATPAIPQLAKPVLTVTPGNTLATPTWTADANATSYTLQYATNSDFTTGLQTVENAISNTAITGLTNDVAYYFRLQAIGDGTSYTTSEWSEAVTVTPNTLITDVLTHVNVNAAMATQGGTSYQSWSNVSNLSDARYAGNSMYNTSYIQIRNNNPSGIVSTTSGGKVKKVSVAFDSSTSNGRYITVYGKNTPYEGPADLYDADKRGTSLGTIVYGTNTELEISGDYYYVGLKASDPLYVEPINISWLPVESYDVNISATNGTITANPSTAFEGMTIALSATANDNYRFDGYTVTNATTGEAISVSNTGTFTMPASAVNVTGTFTRLYTVTILDGIENGTVTASPLQAAEGEEITLTAEPAQHYEFSGDDGWLVMYGEESETVTVENNKFNMPAADVDVFAYFTQKTYTITYCVNGNSHVIAPAQVPGGDAIGTFPTDPVYGEYSFLGWAQTEGGTDYVPASYKPIANMTLYAVFGTTDEATLTITGTTTGIPTSYGSGIWTIDSKQFYQSQIMKENPNQNKVIQFKSGAGILYNKTDFGAIHSIVLTYYSETAATAITVKVGTSQNPSSGEAIEAIVDGETPNVYVYVLPDNCHYFLLTNGSGTSRVSSIDIYYEAEVPVETTITRISDTQTVSLLGENQIIVVENGGVLTFTGSNTNPANIIVEDGGQLFVEPGAKDFSNVAATVQKDIAQHGATTTDGGWNFIASPIDSDIDPTTACLVSDELGTTATSETATYDLYRFIQNPVLEDGVGYEWKNYRKNNFMLSNGAGYLYANKNGVTLNFVGNVVPNTADGLAVPLVYAEESAATDMTLRGWNLVGNPFTFNAYVNMPYYTLDADGTAIPNTTAPENEVPPCTGIMVHATEEGQSITFSETAFNAPNNGSLQMTVGQQTMERGNVSAVDNAIVSFNEGNELQKFYFGNADANLYIPQNDKEYAILSAEGQGEMPLNFRANADGQYTLTVNPEGVEMNYLHLIDNMTGNDVDLLATPSYTFNATTRDYESRFRLVFAANNENGVSAGSTTFAYFSNGSLVVNNEGNATLQVVDVMGRIVKSESINGSASINVNAAPGVYTLRLVNGNDVKTQKVVVR